MTHTASRNYIVPVLLGIGFILNIVYAFYIAPRGNHQIYVLEEKYTGVKTQTYFHHDAKDYIDIAINLLKGNGYSSPLEDPKPTAIRLPAYPLLLAAIFYLFGIHISIAILFQCVLLTFLFYLSYLLARRLFSEKTAIITLIVIMLMPNVKFYGCSYIGVETLTAVFFLSAVVCFLNAEQSRHQSKKFWQWHIIGTLSLVGAGFCRPEFFIFAALLSLWMLRHYRRWLLTICVTALIMTALLAPWPIRNYLVFHRFVPGTTEVGKVLAGCYNPYTIRYNPGSWSPTTAERVPLDATGLDEVDTNKLYLNYAVGQIKQLTLPQFARLAAWKMLRLWIPAQRLLRVETTGVNLKKILVSPQEFFAKPIFVFNISLTIVFLPLYLLFIIGFMLSVRSFRRHELIFYFFILINAIALMFSGSIRYRFMFEPLIAIYCSAMLATLLSKTQWGRSIMSRFTTTAPQSN